MKHRLSSPQTNITKALNLLLTSYFLLSILYPFSDLDEYSIVFAILILIFAQPHIFIRLNSKVFFDENFLYVDKNQIPLEEIKTIEDITLFPSTFQKITFSNKKINDVYVAIKIPFRGFINPFHDYESLELRLLERLVIKKTKESNI